MKASEVKFQTLLNGDVQYLIPLFQRTYRWGRDQWQRLWDDLIDLYENDNKGNHFVGSIVTHPFPSVAGRVTRYSVIDGQQRITTLLILLSLIRDEANQESSTWHNLGDQILESYLINKFAEELEEQNKLKPSRRDRVAFDSLISDGVAPSDDTQIDRARQFFEASLHSTDSIDLRLLKNCITDRLDIVSITLEEDDDPYKIFESLNFTGVPLASADLIRNFIFMNIGDTNEQTRIFNAYWYPMEETLGTEINRFFWRYLQMDGERFSNNPASVFGGIRGLLHTPEHISTIDMAERFYRYSKFWDQLKQPDTAGLDSDIQKQIHRLNQIQTDVVYPALMKALDNLRLERISRHELMQVMMKLESSIVRKIVCDDTRRTDNIYQFVRQIDYSDFVESATHAFSDSNWTWPDERFKDEFVQGKMYETAGQRAKFILESLEQSFGHRESPEVTNNITIEHIMPQTLTDEWKQSLGANWSDDHDLWLHTVGNLTLTAYNPELSNKPFAEKKAILSESNFALNDSLDDYDEWNAETIQQRGRELAERALTIWPR